MSSPRLLLVASFTELEWGIRPDLDEWADVAAFDMPGVGSVPIPPGFELDRSPAPELLAAWRGAAAEHGLAVVDDRGWERFVLVTDSYGTPTAVNLARQRPESVIGLAIGHASLSHGHEGERPPVQAGVWEAFGQLVSQGSDAFVRYGIAQMTRGSISEELAQQMLERFPDMELVSAMVDALGEESEPVGDDLAALGIPLLLAKHEGCLGRTDEGFEDIAAAFPDAQTVICEDAPPSSPAFATALGAFCRDLEEGPPR